MAIPQNVAPLEWLAGMTLLLAHGIPEDEARSIIAEVAESDDYISKLNRNQETHGKLTENG